MPSSGDVFSVAIQGKHDNLPHPHLVLVEISGNCLVVPAFDTTGAELNQAIDQFAKIFTLFRHQIAVDLDNAKRVQFVEGVTGKLSTWFVARFLLMRAAVLATQKKIGVMDDIGMLEVAEGMARYWEAQPTRAQPKYQKALIKLIAALKAKP